MKILFVFVLGFAYATQEELTHYQNEWYSIKVISKNWKINPQASNRIIRTHGGLDTSWSTSFVPENREEVDDCGFSFSIHTYMHPEQIKINVDSMFVKNIDATKGMQGFISLESSQLLINNQSIRTVTSISEITHPGTGNLNKLTCKKWFMEGQNNLYIIGFCSCNFYKQYLPIIEEKMLPTFKEK